jgi:hypothetical protein
VAGTGNTFGLDASSGIIIDMGSNTITGTTPRIVATGGAIIESAGLGIYTTWTPAISASSGTFTTTSAAGSYTQVGKKVSYYVKITITTVGTGLGVIFSLPVAAKRTYMSIGSGREYNTTGKSFSTTVYPNTSSVLLVFYDNGNTGGSGHIYELSGEYEAA